MFHLYNNCKTAWTFVALVIGVCVTHFQIKLENTVCALKSFKDVLRILFRTQMF